MVRLLLVATLGLVMAARPTRAEADCGWAGDGSWSWPAGRVAAERALVLIVRDDHAPGVRHDLRRAAAAGLALRSGEHVVPLTVEMLGDGVGMTQVLLRATAPLRPGQTYALEVEGRRYAWRARRSAPGRQRWLAAPAVQRRTYIELGCGPESHLVVSAPLAVPDGLVRYRARPRHGGPTVEHIVRPIDGEVDLGRSMCWGAAALAPGRLYDIELFALDEDGRELPAPVTIVAEGPSASDPVPPMYAGHRAALAELERIEKERAEAERIEKERRRADQRAAPQRVAEPRVAEPRVAARPTCGAPTWPAATAYGAALVALGLLLAAVRWQRRRR